MRAGSIAIIASVVLAGVVSGCETGGISSRIKEKEAAFAMLNPEEQQTIKAGGVDRGFTADMVYMALGPAAKSESIDTPQGQLTKWTYNKYFGPRPGPGATGTRRDVKYEPSLVSANAPRSPTGIADTKGGYQPNLGVADLEPQVLYVIFQEGTVIDLKLKEP